MPLNGNKLTYTEICELDSEDIIRYLAIRLNDVPDEIKKQDKRIRVLEDWRNYLLGGLVVLNSGLIIRLFLG